MGNFFYGNYPVNVGPGGFFPGQYPAAYPLAYPDAPRPALIQPGAFAVTEPAAPSYGTGILLLAGGAAAALILSALLK